jgi:hypothetical protein
MTEQTADKPKHPGGRPTKYRPEFCDIIIAVGEEGGWKAEMAEACDVVRSTFDLWLDQHPEFSAAYSRAQQKARVYFERTARTMMFADKFNGGLWAKQMAARHPEDYSEKARVDHTSSDGSMTPKPNTTAADVAALLKAKHGNPNA